MSRRLRGSNRNQPFLLPPDLRDWVQDDDLVHFILESTNRVPLHQFDLDTRDRGEAAYDPRMMLALLIYCYTHGIFSSRKIERATYRDISVRYLCANTHPDHDTICTFRRRNAAAIHECFLSVLELAKELGLLKVGTVSLDGTHLKASASKDKNVTYERAQALREQLSLDIKALMDQAENSDQKESVDGDQLPDELRRLEKLKAKMDKACEVLEKRARVRAASEQAAYEKKVAEREKRVRKGRKIKKPKEEPEPTDQANLTDPDSALMRKQRSESFTQSYNGQALVDADGSQLIVGNRLTRSSSDGRQLEPGVATLDERVGSATRVLADAGYVNIAAMKTLEASGIDVMVSVHHEDAHADRKYDFRPPGKIKKPTPRKDPYLVAMGEKLKEPANRIVYRKRAHTVETCFGIIKEAMGWRGTSLRGLSKAATDWELICLSYNVKRLFNLKTAAAAV